MVWPLDTYEGVGDGGWEKLVNMTQGMAVTVEVKTGKRKLIEFLMSRLLRYKGESMREQ